MPASRRRATRRRPLRSVRSTPRAPKRRVDDSVASYSSRGPTWYDGQAKPDVVAPGHALTAVGSASSYLFQTYVNARVTSSSDSVNKYLRLNGTSMAAGVTSGVVALMIEAHRRQFLDSAAAVAEHRQGDPAVLGDFRARRVNGRRRVRRAHARGGCAQRRWRVGACPEDQHGSAGQLLLDDVPAAATLVPGRGGGELVAASGLGQPPGVGQLALLSRAGVEPRVRLGAGRRPPGLGQHRRRPSRVGQPPGLGQSHRVGQYPDRPARWGPYRLGQCRPSEITWCGATWTRITLCGGTAI